MSGLRWGIVGFGAFADTAMAPAISQTEGHEIGAVVSRGADRAKKYADKWHVPVSFGSADAFFDWAGNALVDAVYIVTPNFQHCPLTVAAAEKGLHVLCEKPMANSLEEAGRMIAACRKAGVLLMIGNMMRFNPCHVWAKRLVEEGELGEITEARAVFEYHMPISAGGPTPERTQNGPSARGETAAPNWRLEPSLGGGGALMDVGVHCVDLLRWLTGREVEAVCAFSETGSYPFPADLGTSLLMKFSGGATGSVFASFRNSAPLNTLELRGTKGSLRCEGTLWRTSTGKVTLFGGEGNRTFEASPSNPDPYVLQIRHFAECVETGKSPLVSGEEGYRDLAVCLAAYESGRSGRIVEVSRVPEG